MILAPTLKTLRMMALVVLTAAPAMAAAPAPVDIVNARVAGFKKMSGAVKAIGEQLRSGAPDKTIISAAAKTIAATAAGQGRLFPATTAPSAAVKTDALPAVWTDRATFDAHMAKLVAESSKLVAIAGKGDTTMIGAQIKAVSASCAACHRLFRADS